MANSQKEGKRINENETLTKLNTGKGFIVFIPGSIPL
jgi:hypothetical protein